MRKDFEICVPSGATSVWGVAKARFLDLGREETGAALVITLAMFFLMYLACCGVFAVSTAAKERIHLQNAADAAAYSAAVVQADTLSRIATINRAMSWTYADMTRLQMDYIVRRWLGHTVTHYLEDWKGGTDEKGVKHESLEDYNVNSVFKALGLGYVLGPYNGPCPRHRGERVGWYIGSSSGIYPRRVQLNGRPSFKYRLPKGASSRNLPKSVGSGRVPAVRPIDIWPTTFPWPPVEDLKSVSLENTLMDAKVLLKYVRGDLLRQVTAFTFDLLEIADRTTEILLEDPSLVSVQTRMVVMDNLRMVTDAVTSLWENPKGNRYFDDSSLENAAVYLLKMKIAIDKVSIAKMNVCARHLAVKMPERIDACVENVLDSNLSLAFSGADRRSVQYLLDHHRALGYETTGNVLRSVDAGYLKCLANTKKDENQFLSFADLASYDQTFETGINQWFVRGNGTERTDGAYGLQRSYKHWKEGPFARWHATHSPLMPSCWNTVKLEDVDASVGLFSEWQWFSDTWFCFKVPVPLPPFYVIVHVNAPHMGEDFWPSKAYCSHKSKPGLLGLKSGKITTPNWSSLINGIKSEVRNDCIGWRGTIVRRPYLKYRECTRYVGNGLNFLASLDNLLGNYEPIESYHDGCTVYPDIITSRESLLKFTGYSRLYADDPDLYTSTFVGMKAMPLVVEDAYFGPAGTLSVGIRRQNRNVFTRILGAIEGIFKAFNPDWNGFGRATHTYVFASAKAGYKDKGESLEALDYKVDWQPNNQSWNLCQSDWDAVYVPVRQAKTYALTSFWWENLSTGDPDKVLDDWVSDDGKWRTLDGGEGDVRGWNSISAPKGVLTGGKHNGILDWERLSHVMYH